VRRADIGKAIKKALKHKSEVNDVTELKADVQAIMELWKQAIQVVPVEEKSSYVIDNVPKLVLDMDRRLFQKLGPNVPKIAVPDPVISRESSIASTSSDISERSESMSIEKRKLSADQILPPAPPPQKKPRIITVNLTNTNSIAQTKVESSPSSSSLSRKVSVSTEKSNEVVSLAIDDIADGRDYEAPEIVPFSQNTSFKSKSILKGPKVQKDSGLPSYEPPPKESAPGPGGLKKSSNRSGLVLQFRDSLPGSKISDVILFEVEKIMKKTNAYKSAKDFAKQEKLLEKKNMHERKKDMEFWKMSTWTR
jgi:hypothetical protein